MNKQKSRKPLRRLRMRRKNRKFRALTQLPYSLRTRPVGLGAGGSLTRITDKFSFTVETSGVLQNDVINHMYYVYSNQEFERYVGIYKYFKIIGVKIIVPPRNELSGEVVQTARIAYDWVTGVVENILSDDNAKEITSYQTRNKVFKFFPPNLLIKAPTGSNYVNYNSWLPMSQISGFVPPGYIKISSEFAFDFTVETIVKFRGCETQNTSNNKKIIGFKKKEEGKSEEVDEKLNEEVEKDDSRPNLVDDLMNNLEQLKIKVEDLKTK